MLLSITSDDQLMEKWIDFYENKFHSNENIEPHEHNAHKGQGFNLSKIPRPIFFFLLYVSIGFPIVHYYLC